MRNEELLNKAKEQQCEVKGVVDQISEWEEWEPSILLRQGGQWGRHTFIIYYDKCIEDKIERIARDYEGYNVKFEVDEDYCCHMSTINNT